MQIELSRIKSSPQPVRTSRDEQKLKELTQSIREYGMLQAVGLRPIGDKYEVVFGHRRVEACRRLELTHIEAVVKVLDDPTTLVQALIENVVREDLGAMDKARGLKVLQDETDWNAEKLAEQVGMSPSPVRRLLALLEEPEEVQQLITTSAQFRTRGPNSGHAVTAKHVTEVRQAGLAENDRVTVLRKAAREGLTAAQTRDVADAFKRIENDHLAKQNLTELPVIRGRETLEVLVGYRTEKTEQEEAKVYDHLDDLNVKAFVEAITAARILIRTQWQLVDKNLVGAEHMPYLAKRLRVLAVELNSKASKLDELRAEEVNA